MRDDDGARRPLRQEPAGAGHPDLHHGHELWRALQERQDRPGQGRLHGRLGHLQRRRRRHPRGARILHQVVLPVHPEPLRLQPARLAQGRRLRDLHQPGLQARRGRPPDGPEGDRRDRQHAHPARGHRPALSCAPPRLARPRRSGPQDPGVARGHRLAHPHPGQDRHGPRLRRRAHGRQVRARHHPDRRHGSLHRRRPAHPDRGDRHPAHRGHRAGAQGARRCRPGRGDRPGGGGRHSQRRRRGQGAGARRQGRGHRHGRPHGPQLQQAHPRRDRLSQGGRRRGRRLLLLPHRQVPRRHHHAGPRADQAPGGRAGRAARLQPPARHDAGVPDAGAWLRQDRHP